MNNYTIAGFIFIIMFVSGLVLIEPSNPSAPDEPRALTSQPSAISSQMPVVYDDAGEPAVFGDIVTGSQVLSPSGQIADFEIIRLRKSGDGCGAPRASIRSKAAYVYTYGSKTRTGTTLDAPIFQVNSGFDLEAQKRNIAKSNNIPLDKIDEELAKNDFLAASIDTKLRQLSRIDVLVTETEAPVFLYLASYNPILWNIQLAPGATLDGVVVHGYYGGIIANGTRAERTGYRMSKAGTRCWSHTFGRAISAADRAAAERAKGKRIYDVNYTAWENEYERASAFYSGPLRNLIGKKPDWYLYDGRGGAFNAVLVGPVPDAPFAPQPITRLQVNEGVTNYWGTTRDAYKHLMLRSN